MPWTGREEPIAVSPSLDDEVSACAALRRVAQECPRERLAIHAHQRHPAPGNVSDFDSIYDGVFPQLFRYCHRLTGDADQAEDVAQEAFFRLLTRNVGRTARGPSGVAVQGRYAHREGSVIESRRTGGVSWKSIRRPRMGPADPEREMSRLEDAALVARCTSDTVGERQADASDARGRLQLQRDRGHCRGGRVTSVGTLLARAQQRLAAALDLHGPRTCGHRKGNVMSHWDEGRLMAYLDEELPAEDVAVLEGHVAACSNCSSSLDALESGAARIRRELPAFDVSAPLLRVRATLAGRSRARAGSASRRPADGAREAPTRPPFRLVDSSQPARPGRDCGRSWVARAHLARSGQRGRSACRRLRGAVSGRRSAEPGGRRKGRPRRGPDPCAAERRTAGRGDPRDDR